MTKNAYECLQYSYDWLKMKNGSKDMENILYFKISRWKNALEKQMSEIENKSSKEYQDLEIVRDNFEKATKVTSYNEFKKANGVENIEELKDFLAYGLFCNKISIYEALLEITPNSKSGNIKFYLSPREKCAEVLNEYDKKIKEIQTVKSEEEQVLDSKLQTLIKARTELSNCDKSFTLIATETIRKKYNEEIKKSKSNKDTLGLNNYNNDESNTNITNAINITKVTNNTNAANNSKELLEGINQESAEFAEQNLLEYSKSNLENGFEDSSVLKQTQNSIVDDMPLELQRVLKKSKILVDDANNSIQMTKNTIPATKLISKSLDTYKRYDKMNPENQYLGELYKWAAYVYKPPKIFLNEKDKSGNTIYVCDYGIFVVGTNISPTKEYPKGYIRNTNMTNHIYGVTTLRTDGTNSQHMVISETPREFIKNNKEFCTNIFFNEKYMELAEKKNSHYLGFIKKNDNSEYVIDVNQIDATETVNALNLALVPDTEILLSHDFEDRNGNINNCYKYCTGIVGSILTEKSSLKTEIAYKHADLQELFTEIGSKMLEVVQNINDRKKTINENTNKIVDSQDGYHDAQGELRV